MLLFTLITLVTGSKLNYSNSTSYHNDEDPITITPNAGLYAFNFGRGNAGELANQRFVINTQDWNEPLGFIIFDCYCGGDRFSVQINAENPVPVNIGCELATPKCQGYLGSPRECLDYAWARLQNLWTPNLFCSNAAWIYSPDSPTSIEIEVASTLFGGGTAFLWVYTVTNPDDYPAYVVPLPSCYDPNLVNPLDNCYLQVVS